MALLPVASRPCRTIFRVGAPRICDSQSGILLGILQLEVIGSPVDKPSPHGTHQMEPAHRLERTYREKCSQRANLLLPTWEFGGDGGYDELIWQGE